MHDKKEFKFKPEQREGLKIIFCGIVDESLEEAYPLTFEDLYGMKENETAAFDEAMVVDE